MQVEPIIKSRFSQFRATRGLDAMQEGDAFEKFVNHTILTGYQPDAFSGDDQLLDAVCVGGGKDMGIDGFAVVLNGLVVASTNEVKDILEVHKRAQIEFVFIQSKISPKFDLGEFNKFVTGVVDFLSDDHDLPKSEQIEAAIQLKDYLLSDEVVARWENNPTVRLYYVAMGRWRQPEHHIGLAEKTKKSIAALNTYESCTVEFYDAQALKATHDNNENRFTGSLEAVESMPLTAVDGVDNSCIVLCYAPDYLQLLSTEEGEIRRAMFNDNVRDYLGENGVNSEIDKTLQTNPSKFGLLNNGITIVCDSFVPRNRRISLVNPQVVNGCQTSYTLFNASKSGVDVQGVPLQIKIIATTQSDITNEIVRGTNRQNIVLDETFETTRQFHKDLEEVFLAMSKEPFRIYYERRSRQYQHDPRILQTQRINLRALTQHFIGMFLDAPHLSHRHEAKLLKDYEDRIYLDEQSKYPYFVASLTFLRLEEMLRRGKLDRRAYYSYRAHILMGYRQIVAGDAPNINDERAIDKYCETLHEATSDDQRCFVNMKMAADLFATCRDLWIGDMGRSVYGMKDVPEFTLLLLEKAGAKNQAKRRDSVAKTTFVGFVKKVIKDRHGSNCGFIGRKSGDVFFHSNDAQGLSFDNLEGKRVSYGLGQNAKTGAPKAVSVQLLAVG